MRFVMENLTPDQIAVIDSYALEDPMEYLLEAKVNKILRDESLREKFDDMIKLDYGHYHGLQIAWIQRENHLLERKYGRKVTTSEFTADFWKNTNGDRFKIYYCLKYSTKVMAPSEVPANS